MISPMEDINDTASQATQLRQEQPLEERPQERPQVIMENRMMEKPWMVGLQVVEKPKEIVEKPQEQVKLPEQPQRQGESADSATYGGQGTDQAFANSSRSFPSCKTLSDQTASTSSFSTSTHHHFETLPKRPKWAKVTHHRWICRFLYQRPLIGCGQRLLLNLIGKSLLPRVNA
jgi:hypothetical protein